MQHELGSLLESEVNRTETDFKALRSGAINIVTFSGGLVTLAAGLLAIAAGSETYILPRWGVAMMSTALACYFGAALLAIITNVPAKVTSPDADDLLGRVENDWDRNADWEQAMSVVLVA